MTPRKNPCPPPLAEGELNGYIKPLEYPSILREQLFYDAVRKWRGYGGGGIIVNIYDSVDLL